MWTACTNKPISAHTIYHSLKITYTHESWNHEPGKELNPNCIAVTVKYSPSKIFWECFTWNGFGLIVPIEVSVTGYQTPWVTELLGRTAGLGMLPDSLGGLDLKYKLPNFLGEMDLEWNDIDNVLGDRVNVNEMMNNLEQISAKIIDNISIFDFNNNDVLQPPILFEIFNSRLIETALTQGQYEINPQLHGLPSVLSKLKEGYDETALLVSWEKNEIKILLDYLQENFSSWSKGNKTKFYNDVAKNILPNKKANAIKGRKDWYWYDQLDMIFGTRENIIPSFLANKLTSVTEEETETKKENCKNRRFTYALEEDLTKIKFLSNNSIMIFKIAFGTLSKLAEQPKLERIWEQKMMLEKEKLEKSHELERERIAAEKEKWAYEKEKAKAEKE
ncbi:hypothetical protein C1645_826966 [Glomus cerebriforme]|uniref:Uncharacterized protein n=1 Tax=Glomus cerebriforme TaxID=658196 RepID=A0A397SZ24_9GLOM|nr:hypothetical protein C1645_826966 [Glomus cerebriforme]